MSQRKTSISASPYTVEMELIVCDDLAKANLKGDTPRNLEDAGGAVVFYDGCLSILLKKSLLDHDTIAHECFHATHFILNYCGVRFKVSDRHEAFAYFNGYLNNAVYKQLKKWKIRIK